MVTSKSRSPINNPIQLSSITGMPSMSATHQVNKLVTYSDFWDCGTWTLKPGQFNENYKENTISNLLSLGRMPAMNMRNKNLETCGGKEESREGMDSKPCLGCPLGDPQIWPFVMCITSAVIISIMIVILITTTFLSMALLRCQCFQEKTTELQRTGCILPPRLQERLRAPHT